MIESITSPLLSNTSVGKQYCKLCCSSQYKVVYQPDINLPTPSTIQPATYSKYKITNLKEQLSFKIVQCRVCDLIYMLDHPKDDEILSAYENMNDELYVEEEVGRRNAAKTLLQLQ